MANKYADLHLHVSLKHYVNELGNIWYHKPYKLEVPDRSQANEYTQSDVTSLSLGGVDVAVVALYGLEEIIYETGLGKFVASEIFGFDTRKIKTLVETYNTNFGIMQHERDLIEAGPFQDGPHSYRIVKTKADLAKEGVKLVFSIEGAHSLFGAGRSTSASFEQDILNHLDEVKNWTHPVFMLTLCHFAYNEIADQAWAIPLPKIADPLVSDRVEKVLSNSNQGIAPLGWKVIKKALDATSGKRILIDLKHCSTLSREQYYAYVRNNFVKGEVPIIFSHAGVSGIGSFEAQKQVENRKPNAAKHYDRFNPWEINACDDDIRVIAGDGPESIGGIIGVSLDQRIVGSSNKSHKKDIKRVLRDMDKPTHKRNVHAMLFLENVLHIVKTANHEAAWDHICLSSDNDGVIDPINSCPTSQHLRKFEERLNNLSYWYIEANQVYRGQVFVQDHADLSAKLRKVLYENLRDFIVRYFPD